MSAVFNLNHFGIPPSEQQKFSAIMRERSITKGQCFLRAGQIPTRFGFVTQGLFRFLYVDHAGKEYTKGFFQEGSFIVSYSAMINGTSSYFSIEALEDSEIAIVDYSAWLGLYHENPCWTAMLIGLLQKAYIKKEKRERELLLLDAEERYISFKEEYPELEQRIKQHMIASYIGITPVALSRIRKKVFHNTH